MNQTLQTTDIQADMEREPIRTPSVQIHKIEDRDTPVDQVVSTREKQGQKLDITQSTTKDPPRIAQYLEPQVLNGGRHFHRLDDSDDPLNGMVLRVIPSTLLILLVATLSLVLLKRKGSGKTRWSDPESLHVLESIPLDRKSKLHLIATGTERYLIATDVAGVKSVTLVPNWGGQIADENHDCVVEEDDR